MKKLKTINLTKKEFDNLPEYSCSIPTGTTIGKQWKKNCNFQRPLREKRFFLFWKKKIPHEFDWYRATYEEKDPPDPKMVNIRWEKIKLYEHMNRTECCE